MKFLNQYFHCKHLLYSYVDLTVTSYHEVQCILHSSISYTIRTVLLIWSTCVHVQVLMCVCKYSRFMCAQV